MYDLREDCVRGSDIRAQTRMANWPFRGSEDHDTGPSFLLGEGTSVSCESAIWVRGISRGVYVVGIVYLLKMF